MLKWYIFKDLVNYFEQENFKTLVAQIKLYAPLKIKKIQWFFQKTKQIGEVVCLNSIKYKWESKMKLMFNIICEHILFYENNTTILCFMTMCYVVDIS